MAKAKKTEAAAPQEEIKVAETTAEESNQAENNPETAPEKEPEDPELAALQKETEDMFRDENGNLTVDVTVSKGEPEILQPITPAPQVTGQGEQLFSLDELAHANRVAGWQQSSLMRLMGWQPGKMVTEAEYEAALDQLNNRRQGGGRL